MKKIWILVAFIGIAIIFFPMIMDKLIIGNSISSNVSNSEWVGFLGSYMGSIIGTMGTIGGVYLTIKLEKEKEKENIVVYLNHILQKNLRNKSIIINELLNNIMYKKKYFEGIDLQIYETNFIQILKLRKREEILNIYSIQNEIINIIDNDNITGFLGHLKIKSFEELKFCLKEENRDLIKLEETLEAISVLIKTKDEKKIEKYFKIKEGYFEIEIRRYLEKYQTPIERLKNLRKELLNEEFIMLDWDKVENKDKVIYSNLIRETLKTLEEIEKVALKIEEYYLFLEKYFD